MHLKVGRTVAADGIPAKTGFDLPRGAGSSAKAKRGRSSPTRATTRTWPSRSTTRR